MVTGKLSFLRLLRFLKGERGKQVQLRPNKSTKASKNRCSKTKPRPLELGGNPTFPINRQEYQSQKDELHLINTYYWVLCAGHWAKPNTVSVFIASRATNLLKITQLFVAEVRPEARFPNPKSGLKPPHSGQDTSNEALPAFPAYLFFRFLNWGTSCWGNGSGPFTWGLSRVYLFAERQIDFDRKWGKGTHLG